MRHRACETVRIVYTGGNRRATVTKVLACGHELVTDQEVVDVGLETFHAAVQGSAPGAVYACRECPDEPPPELPAAVRGAPVVDAAGAIPKTVKKPAL